MKMNFNISPGWVAVPLLILGVIGLIYYYGSLPGGQHPLETAAQISDGKMLVLLLSWVSTILGAICSFVVLAKYENMKDKEYKDRDRMD